jgi:hypothetical protein
VAAAQEVLADEIASLVTGGDWRRFLDFQAMLHDYSANNVMLIFAQSQDALDDLDQLLTSIALAPGEQYQLSSLGNYRAPPLSPASHRDAAAAPELEETLFSQKAQGAQDRVRVHLQYGCQISCGR